MAEYKFKFSCRIEMTEATFLQFLDLKNMYFRKIGSDRDFSKWTGIESIDELDKDMLEWLESHISCALDHFTWWEWFQELEDLEEEVDETKLLYKHELPDNSDECPF